MSRRPPAFQFYPGDHRRDLGVQSCSLAARGLWTEMMCLMHEGEQYGHLKVGGRPITPERLAGMVAPHEGENVAALLLELEEAGVFSEDAEDGTIYSRRMVHDEHLRQIRREAGRKGGNPALLNQTDKRTPNQSDNTDDIQSVADEDEDEDAVGSTKNSSELVYPDQFERTWAAYPKRAADNPKRRAFRAWSARLDEGHTADVMVAGVERYAGYVRAAKIEPQFVKMTATFLGPDCAFLEPWTQPAPDAGKPSPGSTASRVLAFSSDEVARQREKREREAAVEHERAAVLDWIAAHREEAEAIKPEGFEAADPFRRVELTARWHSSIQERIGAVA